jgi:hypothetical protein
MRVRHLPEPGLLYNRLVHWESSSASSSRDPGQSPLRKASNWAVLNSFRFDAKSIRFIQDYLTPANEGLRYKDQREHLDEIKRRNMALRSKVAEEEARQRILVSSLFRRGPL